MKFNIITLMPDLIKAGLEYGVVGSSFKNKTCQLELINPRQYTKDAHHTVDDRPFGGGDGMLMLAEPLQKSIDGLVSSGSSLESVYILSPHGLVFNEAMAQEFARKPEITLICGRYGGVDHRFLLRNSIQEISLGDFVLSGGELAALAIVDAVARKIPGVLGHGESAEQDSFAQGLLESPQFTRPQNWEGLEVPPVLLSGDHKKIKEHRQWMGIAVTLIRRPDLLVAKNIQWKSFKEYLLRCHDNDVLAYGFTKTEIINLIQGKL